MVVHFTCRCCGLVLLSRTDRCPSCGRAEIEEVRAPRSDAAARSRTVGESPDDWTEAAEVPDTGHGGSRPTHWEIAYHCPDEFVALTLQSELTRHGITSWIRSLELPGYQGLIQLQPTWGWLLVDRDDMEASLAILREFLDALDESDP